MQGVDLIQRLRLAESDLLTSLLDGTPALASYHQSWSVLPGELLSAMQNRHIGHETLSLAHLVAARISKIVTCFLDIKRDEESYTAQLQNDCDTMLRQMARLNLNALPPTEKASDATGRSNIPVSDIEGPSSLPTSAYRWLRDNLHNPYPTTEVKRQIAAISSCQVSSVNSWFANARRRIGWTALCRDYFSNCRADTIDAAYRALIEEDPRRRLSPELRHSFIAMKVAAEGFYSSTLTSSAIDGGLDAVVKNTPDELKQLINAETSPANRGKTTEHSYPSPAQSVASPPVPARDSSVMDESEEEDVAPPILAGSKRRQSSTEPVSDLPSAARRPTKRLRASTTSQIHLPSPPSSTDGIELSSGASSPRLSGHFSQAETNKALPFCKQYVSDVNYSEMLHGQGGLAVPSRLHSAPGPLPCFSIGHEAIDDWFNTDFDALFALPPPVDTTEPDFSTWKVELFKGCCTPNDPDLSAITHSSDFDCLLQSIPDVPHVDWASLLNDADAYASTINPTFTQYPAVSEPLPDIDLSMLQSLPMPIVQSRGDPMSKTVKLSQLHAMQEAVRRMERELQSEGIIS